MSLKHIRTRVDHDAWTKGDVVIVKKTYAGIALDGSRNAKAMSTRCTKCGGFFPTQYRRMGRIGTKRACEVRNIPQCSPCRSRYHKERKAEALRALQERSHDIARAEGEGMVAP